MDETWDPELYQRFRAERERPGLELLEGLEKKTGGRAVDLGCGTGALTALLHERTGVRETLGLDSSQAMLDAAAERSGGGLRFELARLEDAPARGPFDLLFSNAALHWVPDHRGLLARLAGALAPGGRLAVQVPANDGHVSHRLAASLAAEEPFASALGGPPRESPVLAPEEYAECLHELRLERLRVELRVYLHELPGPESVGDWVRGTTLTWYRARLPAEIWERFEAAYRERLLEALPDRRPFLYTFPRILFWARRPG